MKNLKRLGYVSAALASALVCGAASAAPIAAIDVADIEDSFTNQITPMTAILTVVLGLSALVAVFGYIKRTAK